MPSLQKAGGLKFRNTGDLVTIPNNPKFDIVTTNKLTIETWMNLSSAQVNPFPRIIWFGDYGAKGWNIQTNSTGTVAEIYFASATAWAGGWYANINANVWNHVMFVIDLSANTGIIYVNNVATITFTPTGYISPAPSQPLYIGHTTTAIPIGTIGATRIYNRALSPTEVQMNYQGQVIRDASLVGEWLLNATSGTVATDTSGNGNHGTLNGGQWVNKAVKQKPKKNMLSPFAQWTKHANTVLSSDYSLILNATASFQQSTIDITNISVGAIYTLSVNVDGYVGVNNKPYITIEGRDSSGNAISGSANTLATSNGLLTVSYTVQSNAVSLRIYMNNVGAGTFTFTNPQLELGSTATAFEPYQLVPDLVSVKTKPKKNMIPSFNSGLWTLPSVISLTDYSITINQSVGTPTVTIPVKSGQTYTLQGKPKDNSNGVNTAYTEVWQNGTFLAQVNLGGVPVTFTPSYDTIQVKLTHNTTAGSTYTWDNVQLEQGSVATAFEPYSLVPDLPLAPQGKITLYRGTDFSFARPSVEPYNGLTVPLDTPRVDSNGVIVEEGTVNLLVGKTPDEAGGGAYVFQSDGWTQYIFSAPNYWAGYTGLTYQIGATYTYSVVVKGVAGQQVRLSLYDGLTEFPGSIVTLTGIEQKISFTQTISGSATNLYAFIRTASGVQTIYVKSSQVEQKAYATTFTDNPLGRQAESLTFPTANVLNASAGTIEVWAYEDGTTPSGNMMIFDSDGTYRLLTYKTTNGTYIAQLNGVDNSLYPVSYTGLHLFTCKWDGTNTYFYLDGVLKKTILNTSPNLTSMTRMALGSRQSIATGQWNRPIKSLRISNVARSDQEILDSFNKSQAYMHLPFDDSTTKLLNF